MRVIGRAGKRLEITVNVLDMLQIIWFFLEQNLSNKTRNSTLSLNVLNMLQII